MSNNIVGIECKKYQLGNCLFEVISNGNKFFGIGAIKIGDVSVRSGRLPLRPYTQTYAGLELVELQLQSVEVSTAEIRIRLLACFSKLPIKLMRDHSLDPIHELGDWDIHANAGEGQLDIVLQLASDSFGDVTFQGFSYRYEYHSSTVPLFYLLDKASWEINGDINGATVISQSACSDPVVTFAPDTAWTTEGVLHWADPEEMANRIMTHNLPRWASHQAFDFQYNGEHTLLGVFERVELIRSVICRDTNKAELKTFDKYIFDQTMDVQTAAKKILLHTGVKSIVDQRNLWTWVFDTIHDRARAEYGLREEPMLPRLAINFWVNFTIDRYRRDLLPAAINLGIKQLFVDNLNKSDMTESCPNENMCGGQEYEVSPRLGGSDGLRAFVDDCRKYDIQPMAWTNNDQSVCSPLRRVDRVDEQTWFVKMDDTRIQYGGAYTGGLSIWSFNSPASRYWIDSLKKIRQETGLNGYLFDSFYNLGFMPIDYANGIPRTHWRELLHALKELQDADIHFLIESFGPFGQPQHGCPTSYNMSTLYACYKVNLGNGYSTVPAGQPIIEQRANEARELYMTLAHMVCPPIPLFIDDVRIDYAWGDAHRCALHDYYTNRPLMKRRFLQEDGRAVVWHDETGQVVTLWNFANRTVALPSAKKVMDVTICEELPISDSYQLLECHTYKIHSESALTKIS